LGVDARTAERSKEGMRPVVDEDPGQGRPGHQQRHIEGEGRLPGRSELLGGPAQVDPTRRSRCAVGGGTQPERLGELGHDDSRDARRRRGLFEGDRPSRYPGPARPGTPDREDGVTGELIPADQDESEVHRAPPSPGTWAW
jgi:hypothetical protein